MTRVSLLKDEQGHWSSARCALWVTLAGVLWLALWGPDRPAEVWKTLSAIFLALVGWAGGARVAQYVSQLRSPTSPGLDPENTGITPGD